MFDNIAIKVKPQNGTIILRTYVGAVFFTASLWLGNYLGKSKGTISIFLLFLARSYLYPFTLSVAVIMITNRKHHIAILEKIPR